MKDNVGIEYPSEALWTLTILGGLLLLITGVLVLLSFGGVLTMGVTQDDVLFRNLGLTSQLVAMLFWLFFMLLGGLVWTRAFFRKLSVLGVFTAATAFGLFLSVLLLVVTSFLPEGHIPDEALLIAGLSVFAVVGLLLLIIREVIVAAKR